MKFTEEKLEKAFIELLENENFPRIISPELSDGRKEMANYLNELGIK